MRKWLKDLRNEKRMTQEALAKELGMVSSSYGMIENGERQKDLNLSLVVKLSEIFNVSVDYIVEQERSLV